MGAGCATSPSAALGAPRATAGESDYPSCQSHECVLITSVNVNLVHTEQLLVSQITSLVKSMNVRTATSTVSYEVHGVMIKACNQVCFPWLFGRPGFASGAQVALTRASTSIVASLIALANAQHIHICISDYRSFVPSTP